MAPRRTLDVCIFDNEHGLDISLVVYGTENTLPSLTIPPRYRNGVAQIGNLSDASFSDLVAALKKFPEADTSELLAEKIANDVSSINKETAGEIISALAAMQGIRSGACVEPARFAADLWEAINEDSPDLAADLDEETFEERARLLLSETIIHLPGAKAAEVRREVERSFCAARILTDVRPAFAEDATKRPAMTIMHTLEIAFHDDIGRHREFYVSVDKENLNTLKRAVERAIVKEKTLHKFLHKADFDIYEKE